jgi:serine/threonine protein kinase
MYVKLGSTWRRLLKRLMGEGEGDPAPIEFNPRPPVEFNQLRQDFVVTAATPGINSTDQRAWRTVHDWIQEQYHPGVKSAIVQIKEWYQGRYQLEEFLGAGHTSVVFRAVDTTLERLAAIKLWHTRDSDINSTTLLREAKYLARIDHPNIVKVFDYGMDFSANLPWMCLEYLGRETMRMASSSVGAARPSVHAVIRWGVQLCSIVDFLHNSVGLFQLDLKPDNVALLQRGELVKVMDLGSAADDRNRFDRMGTPGYIAPELLESESADQKCDIFSLGVLLYELLSGENPFMRMQEAVVYNRGRWADYSTAAVPIEPRRRGEKVFSVAVKAFDPEQKLARVLGTRPALMGLLKRMCSALPEERPNASDARLELESLAGSDAAQISLFVSHSHLDKDRFVRQFAQALKIRGFKVWLDEWSLRTGDPFWDKIGQAIQTSDFVLLILSGNSLKSRGVLEELRTAQLFNLGRVKILPLRIDPVRFSEIPPHLRARHVLDFVGWENPGIFEARVSKLASDIRSLRDSELLDPGPDR